MLSFGFPPISSPSAPVLVLGSLPGRLSLERGEYYANPQNAFWKIIATRVPDLPTDYAGRVGALVHHGIALWDVLAAATRSGSLDAAIAKDAIPNNFRALYHAHPEIRLIGFNGATAAKLYARHVLPMLTDEHLAIHEWCACEAHIGQKSRAVVGPLAGVSVRTRGTRVLAHWLNDCAVTC
jgi:hypoxanthine-DNA glycosylase